MIPKKLTYGWQVFNHHPSFWANKKGDFFQFVHRYQIAQRENNFELWRPWFDVDVNEWRRSAAMIFVNDLIDWINDVTQAAPINLHLHFQLSLSRTNIRAILNPSIPTKNTNSDFFVCCWYCNKRCFDGIRTKPFSWTSSGLAGISSWRSLVLPREIEVHDALLWFDNSFGVNDF